MSASTTSENADNKHPCAGCKTKMIHANKTRCNGCKKAARAALSASTASASTGETTPLTFSFIDPNAKATKLTKTAQDESMMKIGNASPKKLDKTKVVVDKGVVKKVKRKREGDDESKAGRAEKRLKQILNNVPVQANALPKRDKSEHQTAKELSEKLQTLPAIKPTYRACYSIVAEPDVTNRGRVKKVAVEVSRFLHISESSRKENVTEKDAVSVQYSCTCSDPGAPKPQIKSDLKTWFQKSNVVLNSCGGTVTIRAEGDASHNGGIPGQKITLVVAH
ncbi:hypothetical protein C8J56DRAFT_1158404 [Mycena floridula]|nr:hypothetical protein C8J56DRAFT_1158404 [Mycena floridula]